MLFSDSALVQRDVDDDRFKRKVREVLDEGHHESATAVQTLRGPLAADPTVDDQDAVRRAAFVLLDEDDDDEKQQQQDAADDDDRHDRRGVHTGPSGCE
ncbi:hypothetical protein ABWH91_12180 [Phycisphaerales bacterium ac7]